jgi:hypothetical protein
MSGTVAIMMPLVIRACFPAKAVYCFFRHRSLRHLIGEWGAVESLIGPIPSSGDDFTNLLGCRIQKGLSEIGVVDGAR